MKQKVRNIKQQKIYRRRRTALSVALVLLIALIVAIYASTNPKTKTASNDNLININGGVIDISKITSEEPNPPAVGAGMIPIKMVDGYWTITTVEDKDWYDYNAGKWANVMLSDGKYSAELERDKELATANVSIANPEDLGTIYTWVPRLCYNEIQVKFLLNTSVIDYKWTTESCFNLEKAGANGLDLGYTGIWVGQTEYASIQEVEQKNAEMNLEENKQGLIANEKVETINSSDKIAVQKLYEKTVGVDANIDSHTVLQNIDTIENRQTIKIVNTNSKLPIVGSHTIQGNNITVKDKYSEFGIKYVIDKQGNVLSGGVGHANDEDTMYIYYLVDNEGNIRRHSVSYGVASPDLRNFSKSNTFYVTYDEAGNELSEIPIGEASPENWYNYENQQWANIVVRNNGLETYYVWIPRYMYKLNLDGTETVDAKIVDLSNVYQDPETGKETNLNNKDYILPEAFTWEDPENPNEKIQLRGFWTSKYKLREGDKEGPEISGGAGVIRVNNILTKYGTEYKYEMYLIQNGKRIVKNGDTYETGTTPIELNGNYIFKDLEVGEYVVNIIAKDSSGNFVRAIANQVTVREGANPNKPDLTGFNKNLTYYVTYDEAGNETSKIPIGEDAPEDWYDYDSSKWANIVVRENGIENYYVWIPRYEYKLDADHEKTSVQFLPADAQADSGYVLPEAFTWEDPENPNAKVQLSGFWASKYKLRDDTKYNLTATVAAGETSIRVSSMSPNVGETPATYEISVLKEGKIIQTVEGTEYTFKGLEAGATYGVNVIAKNAAGNMIAGYSTEVTLVKITVDLTGFNKDTTFYVTYDEAGNEISETPIGEDAPNDWYDYAEQKWANIVVRDNGNENYYVWIPRYQYVTNSGNESVKAEFISTEKKTPDEGYTIPEAFTWENPENANETIQLSGFWASKYKFREGSEYSPEIAGGSGTVIVNNVLAHYGAEYKYEMYLIKDGKRIVQSGNTYVQGTTPTILTGNYIYKNVPEGNYSVNIIVKDSSGNFVRGILQQVVVRQKVEPNKPDLTGFNKNLTYYVTYDDLGNENSIIPIGEDAPNNWYDYDLQQWANIVVKENGIENYYVWVPRYEYKLEPSNERTVVQFIQTNQTIPDEGYTIPEAFTWEDPNNANAKVQLSGFWTSKYKLRDDTTRRLDATVAVNDKKIRVSDISAIGTELNFMVSLIKDGKRVQTANIMKGGEYTFTVSEYGTYSVSISQWSITSGTVASFAKEVVLQEIEGPDLTGFRVDTTYIVTYDSSGNESKTALQDVLKNSAVTNEDKTLKSGEVDLNKISGTWYDYSEQKWANIVTINDGYTNYYTWIPRYEYVLDEAIQKTEVILIPKEQIVADEGYTIPEAFTWEDPNNKNAKVQLSGFWVSKYKLRN